MRRGFSCAVPNCNPQGRQRMRATCVCLDASAALLSHRNVRTHARCFAQGAQMHTRTHSRMHKHACTNPQLRMHTLTSTRSGLSAAYSQSCRARRCGCTQRHATSAMHSKVRSRRVLPTPRALRHSEKRGHRVTHSVMHACASACVSHRRLFPVAMSCTVLQHVVRRCNVVHCGQ